MDRQSADTLLENASAVVAAFETNVAGAKELERQLLSKGIAAAVAKSPPKACCGGGCGCGAKLQVLVREEDVQEVAQMVRDEWLESVRREGTVEQLVPMKINGETVGPDELACPACGFAAPLQEGACADCGLQLE
jgi:hypothetical protein